MAGIAEWDVAFTAPFVPANIYVQAERSKMAELLEERWKLLGLGATRSVQ